MVVWLTRLMVVATKEDLRQAVPLEIHDGDPLKMKCAHIKPGKLHFVVCTVVVVTMTPSH